MIDIYIDPDLIDIGSLNITWHGVFTFVAVTLGIVLIARWALRARMDPNMVYNTAIWAILGGIIGARLVHVIDNWDFYSNSPGQIFALWNGGIGLFGAILGGFVAGALYAAFAKYPIGRLADLSAPAILLGQFVGRIGDIINGGHCAKATGLPWGFAYTHPESNAAGCQNGLFVSVHPIIGYEMIWDLIVFGIIWNLRGRLAPPGMLFLLFVALYSLGRFLITFAREDKVWAAGLQEAHLIALIVLAVAIPWLIYKVRWTRKEPQLVPEGPRRTRAERRRRR